jgi:predicted HTH transcriptional regulator
MRGSNLKGFIRQLKVVRVLAESVDVECKAAQGRDGKGELPEDFWKSYCALANTDGGVIWLGIQEKPLGTFNPIGLKEVGRVRKAIWDNLHNRKQISVNLLAEQHVRPVSFEGKTVLRVEVPRASRQVKPVHLGSNPFGGTYLRRHEGDYAADDETVRRMLAERVEDSRDERVLRGFDFSDLDMESLAAYRNRFSAVKPGHVWLDLPLPDFLERIGGYGRNREEGYSGLRLAGLLMFGRAEVIRDALPYYMVDYQERPEPKAEKRWIDRLVPDGTWSGNLYDFFRRIYQKLTADLKVPFQLQAGQRIEDTPVHEALREALVNTLIHADFTGRVSVLVVKRPDMFGFRNPGLMRVSIPLAMIGGNSDCRNRRLQTMFQLVGYGDHAGSGIPKIYRNWEGQHWRRPLLYENTLPEQTLMELRMTSLVPEESLAELEVHLGSRFSALPELERLAMVTAVVEGIVNHSRLREISTEHPADITKMLAHLVKDGLLVSEGAGRGMVYFAPWQLRGSAASFANEQVDNAGSANANLTLLSQEQEGLSQELGALSQELDVHILVEVADVPPEEMAQLEFIAKPVSSRKRVSPDITRGVVLQLCTSRYLGVHVLAHLLHKDPNDLVRRFLTPLVSEGALRRAFPRPNDPRQAYTTCVNSVTERPKNQA